ncbi:hypothetical protein Dsin_022196 [Dipteronia sinensis]|uniref:HAT C-terminal dimerisation domain-containing protein n=1 Tax=Dipteronia sinensis TaxID=43782 RepID=A0AAE0A2D6_9ROSI|nr:hypothetical protein Dsin_022196 [Dipteronia sinensis]
MFIILIVAHWWTAYGDETPELTSFVVKVLSLTCSSSACKRNWGTFNLHKFLRKKTLKDDEDPLVSEYVPSNDEWMVEEDVIEGTSADVDMS